jgi:hypothetical protein
MLLLPRHWRAEESVRLSAAFARAVRLDGALVAALDGAAALPHAAALAARVHELVVEARAVLEQRRTAVAAAAASAADGASVRSSPASLAELLQPGRRFTGSIKIPVEANYDGAGGFGERTAYYLEVVRALEPQGGAESESAGAGAGEGEGEGEGEDEGDLFLVRHGAHDDEQVCVLSVPSAEQASGSPRHGVAGGSPRPGAGPGEVPVMFSDLETICLGSAMLANEELSGTVEQLTYGEEGYSIKGAAGVHTFHLSPESESGLELGLAGLAVAASQEASAPAAGVSGFAAARAHYVAARTRYALLLALFYLVRLGSASLGGDAPDPELPATDEVCVDLVKLLSELNALLLHRCQWLQRVEFASAEDKSARIRGLSAVGLSRPDAQSAWDAVVRLSTSLLCQRMSRVAQSGRGSARAVQELDRYRVLLHRLQSRVQMSYTRFDKALREAEARVSKQRLDQMLLRPCAGGPEGGLGGSSSDADGNCCICLCALREDGDAEAVLLRTPCSHSFHYGCASRWFHRHSTCPHCRSPCDEVADS